MASVSPYLTTRYDNTYVRLTNGVSANDVNSILKQIGVKRSYPVHCTPIGYMFGDDELHVINSMLTEEQARKLSMPDIKILQPDEVRKRFSISI